MLKQSLKEFTNLTEEQRKAVMTDSSRVVVVACPGSGKTTVLTKRIQWLLSKGVSPKKVCALTFTNKAAGEMSERLKKSTVGGKQVMCKTFHSFGLHIIRNFGPNIGLPLNPTIYDENDRRDIIDGILKESGRRVTKKALESAYKSRFNDTHYCEDREAVAIVQEYTNRMKEQGALDFDMIIMEAVNVLAMSVPAAQHYHDLFDHFLMDEAQDTDRLQHELIACINPKNVFYVADIDQCIYEWRSATPKMMLEVLDDDSCFEVHKLTVTHRCTQEIADIANKVISHNTDRFEKDMVATKNGKKVNFLSFPNRYLEAEFVWDYVESLTEVNTCEPEEIFVLARTNRVVRYLEKVYYEKPRSFEIETTAGKVDMWNCLAVRSMVNTIKLLTNRGNDYLAKSSVFGVKNVHKLNEINYRAINSGHSLAGEMAHSDPWMKDFMEKHGDTTDVCRVADSLSVYFRPVLDNMGLLSQCTLMNNFIDFLYGWKEKRDSCSVGDFIDWHVSKSIQDVVDFENKTVKLMTVHAAKGLEAPYVMIAGLEDDLFPSRRSDIEEERRLFYVAATRAKERLTLLFALDQPSQFIEEAHG